MSRYKDYLTRVSTTNSKSSKIHMKLSQILNKSIKTYDNETRKFYEISKKLNAFKNETLRLKKKRNSM
jgi:hypothetical protein